MLGISATKGEKMMENASKKLNILIVHNYYQIPGGEDTVVANEQRMLKEHGHKVNLYTRHNSELKKMGKLRKLMLPFTTIFNPKTYKDVKNIIKKEKIDIVHVHNTLNLISPSVYYAAVKSKVKVVQTIHNFRFLCPGATLYRDGHICEDCLKKGLGCAVKHRCYRSSKAQTAICVISTRFHRMTGILKKINYICLTDFNKKKLLGLKQISEEQVFVKPNFVESSEAFIPEENREKQFIFAGRLDKLKGIDVLFKAWQMMGSEAPKLIVCGTGPMDEWCHKFLDEHDCNIEMKGFVPNDMARELIAGSKGLILPTQWYEGFPMSIVEAFSVGTPVICSDLGNAGDIVEEGKTGRKFKCDSAEKLKEAVLNTKDMCKSTYDVYLEKYTAEMNYKSLQDIYRMTMGDK